MQSYLSLQKSWGSFHLISRSVGSGLFCMLIFLFQNIPAGKQYKLVVFGEFSPGSRPISNGLNVRRVLRVSIIIKKLFFFFLFVFWSCCELAGVQRSDLACWTKCWTSLPCSWWRSWSSHVLVHCWQWTPQSWHNYGGVANLPLMFDTFLADFALI